MLVCGFTPFQSDDVKDIVRQTTEARINLSGLRENIDPRARWRNAISAARVLSRFGNHKGANNHKDKSVVSSDDEDDDGGGGSTSWRAMPNTDYNNSCRRRRRTIAYRIVGWQGSWRRAGVKYQDDHDIVHQDPNSSTLFPHFFHPPSFPRDLWS